MPAKAVACKQPRTKVSYRLQVLNHGTRVIARHWPDRPKKYILVKQGDKSLTAAVGHLLFNIQLALI